MPTRPPAARDREKPGHADSPRKDTQRPEHSDHADAGGQESTTRRFERTQRAADVPPPAGAPPAPGARHADPPLPRGGRQAQRPGQDGRAEETIGARDVESFRSTDEEGFGLPTPRAFDRAGDRGGDSAASRRTSRASTSTRRDHAVGAEEPPPRRRRRR